MNELLQKVVSRMGTALVGIAVADWENGQVIRATVKEACFRARFADAVVGAAGQIRALKRGAGDAGDAPIQTTSVTRGYYHLTRLFAEQGTDTRFAFLLLRRDTGNRALAEYDLCRLAQAASLLPDGAPRECADDELPAFLREDSVMRLLGIQEETDEAIRALIGRGKDGEVG